MQPIRRLSALFQRLTGRDLGLFMTVSAVIFVTRIPFLDAGYGEPDAWRVALAAKQISLLNQYFFSRPPGYPVQEFVSSLLWRFGPIGLNGATAFMSAIGAGFVALVARKSGARSFVSAAFALAFIPLFYTNSVQALDTPWALAFIVASIYFTLRGWTLLGALALGLAIGCRITSVVALVPVLILLSGGETSKGALFRALRFSLVTLLLGALCYLPAYQKYGADFLVVSGWDVYHPDWKHVLSMAFDGIWGRLGKWVFISAIVGAGVTLYRRRHHFQELLRSGHFPLTILAWLSGLGLFVIAFLVFPHQRYLVTALPFLVWLFASLYSPKGMRALMFGALVAAFVNTCGESALCKGPVPNSFESRQRDVAYVRQIIERGRELGDNAVIAVASWLPKIEVLKGNNYSGARFVYTIDSTFADSAGAAGQQVYYIKHVPDYNKLVTGVKLDSLGARALFGNE